MTRDGWIEVVQSEGAENTADRIIELYETIERLCTSIKNAHDALRCCTLKYEDKKSYSMLVVAEAAREALRGLLDEYEDRKSQFGTDYLWKNTRIPRSLK